MGKNILVTGASTGIGNAIARELSGNGFHVFAGVRKKSDFEKMQIENCTPIYLDVLKPDEIIAARELIKKQGSLFALVNNAGVAVAGPVEGVPMDQLRYQMNVNFFAVYEVTQIFLPLLRQSRGRIVNIGSISGKIAPALFTPYSCSKFAIEAFSDGLRREIKDFGVHVSLIEPGSVKTPIWQKSKASNEAMLEEIPKEIQELYSKHIERLRKMVENAEKTGVDCKEVTEAVLHAVSSKKPKSRYVIGRDAKAASFLTRILPDSILDRIVKVV